MVSFQCHACGDVVKKPKLDQHRMRCHSGYDCIDCSKTFNSPAEYKGHTSCISEAEKYQKGLYKGPKTQGSAVADAPKTNGPLKTQEEPTPAPSIRTSNAQWNHVPTANGNGNGNGYPGGRGGYGGGYGSWNRRSNLTGANDTPLGTSTRSSPVTQPSPAPAPVAEAPPKTLPSETNGATVNGHKKDNKRKSAASDDIPAKSNKKAKVSEEKVAALVEPGPSTEEVKKEKKSKKEKKDKDADKVEKKKKSKGEDGDVETAAPPAEEDGKKKKKEKKREEVKEVEVNGEEDKAYKKKEKKEKKRKEAGDVEMKGAETKSDKKKKTDTIVADQEELASPLAEKEVVNGADATQGQEKKKKKKEKKDKPPGDAMEIDSTTSVVDATKKKDKKQKKDKHLEALPSAITVS